MRKFKSKQEIKQIERLLAMTMIFAEGDGDEGSGEGDNATPSNVDNKGSDSKTITTSEKSAEENGQIRDSEADDKAIDGMAEFMSKSGLSGDKYDPKKVVSGVPDKKTEQAVDKPDDKADEDSDDESKKEVKSEKFKINKQEFTKAEILAKAGLEYGIDVSKMTAEKADRLVKDFVDAKNLTEGKKSANANHQKNAEERKALDKEKADMTAQQTAVAESMTKLTAENEKLSKEIEELQAKIEEEYDDDKRTRMLTKEVLLTNKLEELEEKKSDLTEKAKEIDQNLNDNYVNDICYSLMTEFAEEFKTEKPIATVLQDLADDNMAKHTADDCIKAERLETVVQDYLTKFKDSKKAPTIVQYYDKFRTKYNPFFNPSPKATEKSVKENLQTKLDEEKAKKLAAQSEKNKSLPIDPKSKLLNSTMNKGAAATGKNILAMINQAG